MGLAASPLDPDLIEILREKHVFGLTSRIVGPRNTSRCLHNLNLYGSLRQCFESLWIITDLFGSLIC